MAIGLPVRLADVSAAFVDHEGEEIPGFESIHHRDETLVGQGDVEAGGEVQLHDPLAPGPWTLRIRGGLTLPTGGTEPDPFALGDEGKAHQHLFFGTGTLDPYLGAAATWTLGPATLLALFETRGSLAENRHGYRGPWSTQFGAGASSPLGLERWSFLVLAEVFHERAATWQGRAEETSGRTSLLAAAGVTFSASRDLQVSAVVRKPVFTEAMTGSLEIPFVAGLTAAWTLPSDPP